MAQESTGSVMARSTLAYLRLKVVSGEWPINSRIPTEPELMEMIGVGKSTLREAVRALAHLGMLETIRGIGTFVRSRAPISFVLTEYLGDYPLDQILVYRRALEIEAARLAALNRTEAQLAQLRAAHDLDLRLDPARPRTIERGTTPGSFHHLIVAASGVELLSGLYAGVMAAIRKEASANRSVQRIGHDLRQREHEAVLEAVEAQDAPGAASAMALHVDHDMRAEAPGFDPDQIPPRAQAFPGGPARTGATAADQPSAPAGRQEDPQAVR